MVNLLHWHQMGDTPLKPDQIRVIREGLGLSQREAGSILGGGPNAFAKYESGTLAPAAALANLLLVLGDNPATLRTLRSDHVPVRQPLPFQVASQHVGRVDKQMFPQFLRWLLQAEALSHGIPSHGIHVADNVDAPDGGEDGCIRWQGGPEQTRFLPNRFTQFQLKTGDILPAAAGKEVLSKTGEVKPMVRSAFAEGATYMVLSTRTYTREQLEKREGRIRAALKGAGLDIDDHRVHFRDASQLADWANAHPAVATWFLEKVEPAFPKEFRSWSHWAGRREHIASPWVEDERLSRLRQFFHQQAIAKPRKTARIVGLWGIGKSRLALEAFHPTRADDSVPTSNLSSLVLYAVESEVGSTALQAAVQRLADSRARAIVIVDECAPKTHRALVGMVERETSQLSLVTLDDEIPPETLNASTHKIEEAPDAVTEAIVNGVASGLQGEDQRRLARFSRGFPRMSILIAQAWRESTPLAHATEQDLVKSYILGRDPDEAELVLKSARLLATFGLINDKDSTQFNRIASFGRNLNAQDLRVGVMSLTKRGVARRWSDRYVSIEPRPIAMWLAEQQWQEWGEDTWDKILADSFPSTIKLLGSPIQIDELGLHVQAAKQLKLLKQLRIAQDVVKHVCRDGGPLDNLQGNLTAGHAEVLSYLAEINPSAVAEQIRRLLDDVEDLSLIAGDSRSHLVRALEKISFPRETFEDGARLLLRLAVAAENQEYANSVTGQPIVLFSANHAPERFIALFPLLSGGTQADGTQRLNLLRDLSEKDNIAEQEVLIKALARALELNNMRVPGVEAHGTQPALNPWKPKTKDEEDSYIRGCVTRLFKFPAGNNATSALARDALGTKLRSLLQYGFIDMIESIVNKVGVAVIGWPQALESLNDYLLYDSDNATNKLIERVRYLVRQVEPKSLEDRLRFLVNEMPWDYLATREDNFEKRTQRQVNAVQAVAAEALQQPETLRDLLPQLSRGQQPSQNGKRSPKRMARVFGQALGENTDPREWLHVLTQAVEGTPEAERCYDLLVGYLTGLAKHQPDVVEAFKQSVAQSPVLAPTLPMICISIGSTSSDLMLIISALQIGTLFPCQLHYAIIYNINNNASLQAAVELIDVLIHHSDEGLAKALELLGLLDGERLEIFRRQIRKIAEDTLRLPWVGQSNSQSMMGHFFEELMTWMLKQESGDHDVVATAMALAKVVARLPAADSYDNVRNDALRSILPILLSRFSGVAWPLIGAAIISTKGAYVFQSMMRGKIEIGHPSNPPILSLPEDTLFAWCHAHPEYAPAFAAMTLPFLTSTDNGNNILCVHPVMIRLLEDFGDRKDIIRAIDSNMCTGAFSGPMSAFYEKNLEPVKRLLEHSNKNVRRWAKAALREIQAGIEQARNWDAHSQARFWE